MKKLIVDNLPETTFKKLVKKKSDDGFTDKDWADWLNFLVKDVRLKDTMDDLIHKGTRDTLIELWVGNFGDNLEAIRNGKTIADLVPEHVHQAPDPQMAPPKGSAIVIGRGKSVFVNNHLPLLAESGYKGAIIATDGMLIECLKNNVIPTHVVSVDGNKDFIWKWYDDPLVDKYGKDIKAILCSSVAHNVYERCVKAGIEVYWFNPIYDDWRQNESFTKINTLMSKSPQNPRGLPSMNCGGNCGATAWVIAFCLLRRSPVALIGIDLGYLEGTPLEETSYYKNFIKVTGGNVELAKRYYTEIYHPIWKKKAYTDPVFNNYRESFRQMVLNTPPFIRTINCSEGGTVFGERIECIPFKQFLETWKE
jgi:hypothetical protein